MKPHQLIEMLQKMQPDAEIVVEGYSCDILADYQFADSLVIEPDVAMKDERGVLHARYSNYARGQDVSVYVIRWGYK